MTLKQFFPFKRIVVPMRPGRKIGQGQPRVIIYINFVELESPILHAKFQGLLVLKETFLKVLIINEHGGHLGHGTIYINFCHPSRKLHVNFDFDWSSGFRGKGV